MADDVFAALGDPTRRWIVERLSGDGPRTATQLAAELPITRQAVAKHLTSLAEAGLVDAVREGRETRYELQTDPLESAAEWATSVGARWDQRLDKLRRGLS